MNDSHQMTMGIVIDFVQFRFKGDNQHDNPYCAIVFVTPEPIRPDVKEALSLYLEKSCNILQLSHFKNLIENAGGPPRIMNFREKPKLDDISDYIHFNKLHSKAKDFFSVVLEPGRYLHPVAHWCQQLGEIDGNIVAVGKRALAFSLALEENVNNDRIIQDVKIMMETTPYNLLGTELQGKDYIVDLKQVHVIQNPVGIMGRNEETEYERDEGSGHFTTQS